MISASTLLLCRSAVSLSSLFFVAVTKPESLRQSISRLMVVFLLLQPMLIQAEILVHATETSARIGVEKIGKLVAKGSMANAKTPLKVTPSMGIDQWIMESNATADTSVNAAIKTSFISEKPTAPGDLKSFSSPLKNFPSMAMTMFQAGTSLEMGTTGPAGNGPTATTSVTLFENGTTAYTPTTSVTYTQIGRAHV